MNFKLMRIFLFPILIPIIILVIVFFSKTIFSQDAFIGEIRINKNYAHNGKKCVKFDIYNVTLDGMRNKKIHFAFNILQEGKWFHRLSSKSKTVSSNEAYWEEAGRFSYQYQDLYDKGVNFKKGFNGCFYIKNSTNNTTITRKCVHLKVDPKSIAITEDPPLAGVLERIKTIEISGSAETPIAKPGYTWGIAASFKKPEFEKYNRIVAIETFKSGDILLLDKKPALWRISSKNFKPIWEKAPASEHMKELKISPDEKTFAISYTLKGHNDFLEIRSTVNGELLSKFSFHALLRCGYKPYHTLTAWSFAYSPDGSKIVAWFHNGRTNQGGCLALESDTLVAIDVKQGKVLKKRENFFWDFWPKTKNMPGYLKSKGVNCGHYMPLKFDNNNRYFYLGNCNSTLIKYNANTLQPVKLANYFDSMKKIIEGDLKRDLLRYSFKLDTIYVDPDDGSLMTMWGGQGDGIVFRINPDMTNMSFYTINQGSIYTHTSKSLDRSLIMINHEHINLWDLDSKKALFYGHMYNAHHMARFHPKKRAIIFARDMSIRIIAELPLKKVQLRKGLNTINHRIYFQSTYCVRGPGKFRYFYQDSKDKWKSSFTFDKDNCDNIHPRYATRKDDSAYEEAVKIDIIAKTPGVYTMYGIREKAKSPVEIVESLPNWR